MRPRNFVSVALALCAVLLACAPIAGAADGALASPPAEAHRELPDAASREAATDADGLDLTLTDAIALAMHNNRRLVNGRLTRAVERFALEVAHEKFKPKFRLSSFQRFETEEGGWARDDTGVTFGATLRVPTGGRLELVNAVSGGGIADQDYGNSLTLRFTQPLLKGGGIAVNTASLRIARARERIGILVFERTIGDVANSVVFAYRNLLQAQRRVDIGARSLQRAKDLLAKNRSLIQAGRMAELEIVQTEANVAERELQFIGAENRLDAARLALIDILDIDSETAIRPVEALTVDQARFEQTQGMAPGCPTSPTKEHQPTVPHGETESDAGDCAEVVAQFTERALANRPAYLQALLRVENAEAELLLAKNNRLWDLSTTFSADVSGNAGSLHAGFGDSFGLLPDNDLRVAVQLSVPIRDIASKQRYIGARTNLQRARVDLAELRQSIDISVRNALRNVDTRLRQVALATRASELAERKLDAEEQKLNLGLTTNYRIILFEDDLVRAQTSELSATLSYLNALSSLDQTLGTTLQTWGLEVERVERLGDASAFEPAGPAELESVDAPGSNP